MKRRYISASAAILAVVLFASCARAYNIGKALEWKYDRNSVTVKCEGADVTLSFQSNNILRVEVAGDKIQSGFPSPLLVEQGPAAPLNTDQKAKTISNGALTVVISDNPFGFKLLKGNKILMELAPNGVEWKDDGSYILTFGPIGKDKILGLGEPLPDILGVPLELDYRKRTRAIWNNHVPPADLGLPFFYDTAGFGLFIDNPWKAEFDLGTSGPIKYSAAGGPIRFFVMDAPDPFSLLDSYTSLTGRPPMPPLWSLGYMQSRYGYKSEADFRWLMENFRSRKIPCDALIFDLDWFGVGGMGNFWWFDENFPNAEAFQQELEKNGFKSIVITEPFVFSQSTNYLEAREKKLFTRGANGQTHLFAFWGRPSSLLDFTNEKTRDWYGNKVKKIKLSGVDGWWTDLNEPETDADTHYKIGPREAGHNLVGFFMDKAIYDMYQKDFPNERPFIMTRSGFAGTQRLGAGVWSGDVTSSWNHLRDQIPIAISTGLSGISSWNSDTGGFHGHPSPELYTRWIQFSSFCPVFRSHGNHDVREPWSFGDESERINKKYIELRMKLLPYLYTLFYDAHKTGAPVIRPTFMQSPDADVEITTQFFFGPEMLIAPVTEEGAKKKTVVLPVGKWFYWWDDRTIEGPKRISVPVDLGTMPIFVREGAIIPMWPVMQFTSEKKQDPLEINYYPSDTASSYELYEDDGASAGYLRGEFALTRIYARRENKKVVLKVSDPAGKYIGMPSNRSYKIIIHNAPGEGKISFNGLKSAPTGSYLSSDRTFVVDTQPLEKGFSIEVRF
jgi:alpha-glucosidase